MTNDSLDADINKALQSTWEESVRNYSKKKYYLQYALILLTLW